MKKEGEFNLSDGVGHQQIIPVVLNSIQECTANLASF